MTKTRTNTILMLNVFLTLMMGAQTALSQMTSNRLSLRTGFQHLKLLDEQATPVLYRGVGPAISLTYDRRADDHWWEMGVKGGMLAMEPADPELRFYDSYLSGITANLCVSYLHRVKKNEKLEGMLGASIREELLVDFNEVGRWPYALAQGGLYAMTRWNYTVRARHQIGATVAVPVLPVVTDLPFHQIPRVPERAPDVSSLFQVGTRIPFWNSYQRVDLRFSYEFHWAAKWNLDVQYNWSWFHDSIPRDLWAYQGNLMFGLIRQW